METVSFRLSGTARSVALKVGYASGWPYGANALRRTLSVRRGIGRQFLVTMPVRDARELADYLDAVAEAEESMTAVERGGRDHRDACRRAAVVIRTALAPPGPTTIV